MFVRKHKTINKSATEKLKHASRSNLETKLLRKLSGSSVRPLFFHNQQQKTNVVNIEIHRKYMQDPRYSYERELYKFIKRLMYSIFVQF